MAGSIVSIADCLRKIPDVEGSCVLKLDLRGFENLGGLGARSTIGDLKIKL